VNDLLFVAIMLAFFSLAALFVRACDRIIGPDQETTLTSPPVEADPEQVAA